MNCYPSNVKININSDKNKKFNSNNCNIWAFGYEGQIKFDSTGILAYTESPLDSKERYVNIVAGFNKGVLLPHRKGEEESFNQLVETAKEGSSYGSYTDDDTGAFIVITALFFISIITATIFIVISIIRRVAIKKFVNQVEYFRETPCSGDIEIAYCIARLYHQNEKESSIIGACLLDLINQGCLEPVYESETGFMGKVRKNINLKLAGTPISHNTPCSKLYNILFKAAGKDGILQEKELKKYCSKHPEKLRSFIDDVKSNGEIKLEKNGDLKKNINKSSDFTKKQLAELAGLKKYLLDFSLINERGIEENSIWEDYLVYATLLDIADKVMEQFKKVYPEKLPELDKYDNTLWLVYSYRNITYNAMIKAEAARNSGSGGSSSFTGGGGFSGGGSGGGSR